MSFGGNLRALLEERNLTQKELAGQLNIAPSTMGSYVQNVREPDFATLKTIANYFGVTIDYLLDNHTAPLRSVYEEDLLRIFYSLSPQQQEICVEQCRVFLKLNEKEKKAEQKSS